MDHVKIRYSNGRGKSGRRYAFIRPAFKCSNRSRRCRVDRIETVIEKYYPIINYYKVDGFVIGAKDEEFALQEYWKICAVEDIGKPFLVEPLSCDHPVESQRTWPQGGMYCADCGASEV